MWKSTQRASLFIWVRTKAEIHSQGGVQRGDLNPYTGQSFRVFVCFCCHVLLFSTPWTVDRQGSLFAFGQSSCFFFQTWPVLGPPPQHSCKTFCKDGSHCRDLWMHVVTYGVQPLPFWPFLRSIPAHVETRKFSWTSGKGTLSLLYLFFFIF